MKNVKGYRIHEDIAASATLPLMDECIEVNGMSNIEYNNNENINIER